MSHFNVSLIVWAKSQDSVHKPQFFEEKRKESRSGSNQGPSAFQPSALPLGHTGSQHSMLRLPVYKGTPAVAAWSVPLLRSHTMVYVRVFLRPAPRSLLIMSTTAFGFKKSLSTYTHRPCPLPPPPFQEIYLSRRQFSH